MQPSPVPGVIPRAIQITAAPDARHNTAPFYVWDARHLTSKIPPRWFRRQDPRPQRVQWLDGSKPGGSEVRDEASSLDSRVDGGHVSGAVLKGVFG